MDKHHDDGGGVAGANLGGVAGANGGGVAGDNEEPRLVLIAQHQNVVSLGSLPRKDAKLFVAAQNVGRKALFHFLPTHLLTL